MVIRDELKELVDLRNRLPSTAGFCCRGGHLDQRPASGPDSGKIRASDLASGDPRIAQVGFAHRQGGGLKTVRYRERNISLKWAGSKRARAAIAIKR